VTSLAPSAVLSGLPSRNDGGLWLAVIEASQGSRHKFKYEAAMAAFVLSGVLPAGLCFPHDFGFIPSTLGDDGDPLDVLVLADEPLPVGVIVLSRVVGVIEARQQAPGKRAERNDRLIAVAAASHRYVECAALADLSATMLGEIERFFVFYNQEKGTRFTPLSRRNAATAERLIRAGQRRFAARTSELE